jgi:hypothetical protein
LWLGPLGGIIYFSALAYWGLKNNLADDLKSDTCCQTKIAVLYGGKDRNKWPFCKIKSPRFRNEFRRINAGKVI